MYKRNFVLAGLVVAMLAVQAGLQAQEPPQMPKPEKEHAWLQHLTGEWDTEAEMFMEPGKPPLKAQGSESARMVGGFWLLAEAKGEMMGMEFRSVFTLGYDAQKKKYIGTWIDNCTNYLWKYEGTVDSTGKVLTLETEGPCPMSGGKLTKFKEVIEIKDKDHKFFTSSMQGEDGKWTTIVSVNYRRKK